MSSARRGNLLFAKLNKIASTCFYSNKVISHSWEPLPSSHCFVTSFPSPAVRQYATLPRPSLLTSLSPTLSSLLYVSPSLRSAALPSLSQSFGRPYSFQPSHSHLSVTSAEHPGGDDKQPAIKLDDDVADMSAVVDMMEEVVRSSKEVSGGEPTALTGGSYLRLAQAYHRVGEQAEKVLEAAREAWKWYGVKSEEKDLGRVQCLHLMAAAMNRMGKPSEALQYLQLALKVPDDMATTGDHALMRFSTYMLLGDTWMMLSGHKEGQKAYKIALGVQEQALGPEHQSVADTCRHVAEIYSHSFLFDDAEPLALRALEIHSAIAKPDSLDEAIDRRLLAAIYTGLDQPLRALSHLEVTRALLMDRRQGLDAALTDVAIGDTLVSLDKSAEALTVYEVALKVLKDALGESHSTVGSVYASMAEAHSKAGHVEEAHKYCSMAVAVLESKDPEDALETANTLAELANTYEGLEQVARAAELLRRSILLRLDLPGQMGTIASLECRLGAMLLRLDNPVEALQALRSCLDKFAAAQDTYDPYLPQVYYLIGVAIMKAGGVEGSPALALSHFEKARTILEAGTGDVGVEDLPLYEAMAQLLFRMGRVSEALACQQKVVTVKGQVLGDRHPETAMARTDLKELQGGGAMSRQ